eukprot:1196222-Prorocentrum_minimum.AAC.2
MYNIRAQPRSGHPTKRRDTSESLPGARRWHRRSTCGGARARWAWPQAPARRGASCTGSEGLPSHASRWGPDLHASTHGCGGAQRAGGATRGISRRRARGGGPLIAVERGLGLGMLPSGWEHPAPFCNERTLAASGDGSAAIGSRGFPDPFGS